MASASFSSFSSSSVMVFTRLTLVLWLSSSMTPTNAVGYNPRNAVMVDRSGNAIPMPTITRPDYYLHGRKQDHLRIIDAINSRLTPEELTKKNSIISKARNAIIPPEKLFQGDQYPSLEITSIRKEAESLQERLKKEKLKNGELKDSPDLRRMKLLDKGVYNADCQLDTFLDFVLGRFLNHRDPEIDEFSKENELQKPIVIEAGAFDGESGSNSLFLERYRGFDCILVEPIPKSFESVKSKGRNCYVINAGLKGAKEPIEESKIRKKLLVNQSETDLELAIQREKSSKAWNAYWGKMQSTYNAVETIDPLGDQDNIGQPQKVPLFSVPELLQSLNRTTVDVLSLDIENGNEIFVLNEIDFEETEVGLIVAEVGHMDARRILEIKERLEKNGFIKLNPRGYFGTYFQHGSYAERYSATTAETLNLHSRGLVQSRIKETIPNALEISSEMAKKDSILAKITRNSLENGHKNSYNKRESKCLHDSVPVGSSSTRISSSTSSTPIAGATSSQQLKDLRSKGGFYEHSSFVPQRSNNPLWCYEQDFYFANVNYFKKRNIPLGPHLRQNSTHVFCSISSQAWNIEDLVSSKEERLAIESQISGHKMEHRGSFKELMSTTLKPGTKLFRSAEFISESSYLQGVYAFAKASGHISTAIDFVRAYAITMLDSPEDLLPEDEGDDRKKDTFTTDTERQMRTVTLRKAYFHAVYQFDTYVHGNTYRHQALVKLGGGSGVESHFIRSKEPSMYDYLDPKIIEIEAKLMEYEKNKHSEKTKAHDEVDTATRTEKKNQTVKESIPPKSEKNITAVATTFSLPKTSSESPFSFQSLDVFTFESYDILKSAIGSRDFLMQSDNFGNIGLICGYFKNDRSLGIGLPITKTYNPGQWQLPSKENVRNLIQEIVEISSREWNLDIESLSSKTIKVKERTKSLQIGSGESSSNSSISEIISIRTGTRRPFVVLEEVRQVFGASSSQREEFSSPSFSDEIIPVFNTSTDELDARIRPTLLWKTFCGGKPIPTSIVETLRERIAKEETCFREGLRLSSVKTCSTGGADSAGIPTDGRILNGGPVIGFHRFIMANPYSVEVYNATNSNQPSEMARVISAANKIFEERSDVTAKKLNKSISGIEDSKDPEDSKNALPAIEEGSLAAKNGDRIAGRTRLVSDEASGENDGSRPGQIASTKRNSFLDNGFGQTIVPNFQKARIKDRFYSNSLYNPFWRAPQWTISTVGNDLATVDTIPNPVFDLTEFAHLRDSARIRELLVKKEFLKDEYTIGSMREQYIRAPDMKSPTGISTLLEPRKAGQEIIKEKVEQRLLDDMLTVDLTNQVVVPSLEDLASADQYVASLTKDHGLTRKSLSSLMTSSQVGKAASAIPNSIPATDVSYLGTKRNLRSPKFLKQLTHDFPRYPTVRGWRSVRNQKDHAAEKIIGGLTPLDLHLTLDKEHVNQQVLNNTINSAILIKLSMTQPYTWEVKKVDQAFASHRRMSCYHTH